MRNKAFTLIELMVVILIVGILAAASVPLMRSRVDSAKWAEANATAGTIRSAARVYFAEHGTVSEDWADLGFDTAAGDLAGTYFGPSDYEITSVDSATGNVAVTVSVSKDNGPKSPTSKTLDLNGNWN